jgi:hypothetical protein
MEHINLWKSGDPALFAMLGQPLPPPPTIPGVPPPEGGAPQPAGEKIPPEALKGAAEPMAPGSPVEKKAEKVRMPNQPTNPLTGQKNL